MGRYRVIQELGRGGMGRVWLAQDVIFGDTVVLKRPLSATPEAIERARREALALQILRMPGVVVLRDQGEDEEGWFLVTERIAGDPFPGPATDPDSIALVAVRLLEILARVHTAGIIHRDLKPSNVLPRGSARPRSRPASGRARGRPPPDRERATPAHPPPATIGGIPSSGPTTRSVPTASPDESGPLGVAFVPSWIDSAR